ncbi:MAG: YjbH domain-containing protein, partial [Bacteroidetes bacterium]|nr:YjbH domain-containing protein [Bacteroidota bacterium]
RAYRQPGSPRGSTELVPLLQGVPVGAYRLTEEGVDFRALTRGERRAYHRAHPINPLTSYRFDFKIQPEFIANFGNFQRPVESRTSVLLQSQLYGWRGLVVHYGLLFPLVNHLDGRPDNIRPAPFYANQFLALGGPHFLSVSAGLFPSDAWGGNVQYQRMDLDGRWSWGLEAGLTGFYYYPRGGIYYTRPDELLLLGNVAYRHPAHDLTVKLTAGQYPAGDRGARMDMIRQFTNVEVALYATKTGNGATVGFNLAVPIPPGKIVQGRYVRLRTTEEFRWEYTYTRGYKIGERYRLGYQLDERLRQYHRGYLSNQWRRSMRTE